MGKNQKTQDGRGRGRNRSGSGQVLRKFSAGGVVYRSRGRENLFLIIKPVGTERWQLPKGTIDKGESAVETAVREVKEEGGVETEAVGRLGISQYFFVLKGEKIFKTVTYFLLKYKKGNVREHDHEVSEAVFEPFEVAHGKLTFKDDKVTLEKAREQLKEAELQPSLV